MRDYNVTIYDDKVDSLVHFVLPSHYDMWSDEFLELVREYCECRDIFSYFLVSIEYAGGC